MCPVSRDKTAACKQPYVLVRYINQGRADAEQPHIAPRKTTQILLTRPGNLADGPDQTAQSRGRESIIVEFGAASGGG